VLEELMDIDGARKVIEGIEQGLIRVKQTNSPFPSPFALNIAAQGRIDLMKIEDKLEFIRRMHEAVEREIAKGK
jgi:ATP-dependent Lhr-like helicase